MMAFFTPLKGSNNHANGVAQAIKSQGWGAVQPVLLATVAVGLLSGCVNQAPPAPAAEDTRVTLRLMHTTDVHAYMVGYDYFANEATDAYGLAHTAALIAQARAENPNHFLVDNGDLIQGAALGDWVAEDNGAWLQQHTHPVIAGLNYLEYDVANIGNHEFDFGLDFLDATMSGANFPIISANVFHADSEAQAGRQDIAAEPSISERTPLFEPYVIKTKQLLDEQGQEHTIRVGFIGFVPPQIMNWNTHHLAERVAVYDIIEAAEYFVPQMREAGADVVVAVPHSGLQHFDEYPQFAEQVSVKLAQVDGIDAIQFGHQHNVFPGDSRYDDLPGVDNERGYIHGVPAAQPGYWGSHLGIIDLTLAPVPGGWQVVGSEVNVPRIDDTVDEGLVEVVDDAHQATVEWLQTPVVTMRTGLRNYFAMLGPEHTVQLINQAQLAHGHALQRLGVLPSELPVLSAAAPFRNGGQGPHDYTSIDPGELTLANIKDMYVYPNTVQVVQLSGAQVRDWLEMSARVYSQISMQADQPEPLLAGNVASFNFDIIAGITYEIQPHHPVRFDGQGELINPRNHRIYNLRYNGELVGADDQFLVVTNNYRAGGGGNFPHLDGSSVVYRGAHEVRELLLDHIGRLNERHQSGYRPRLEENWYLVLPRGAQVYIHSSPAQTAIEQSERQRDIQFIEVDDNGYGRYRVLP